MDLFPEKAPSEDSRFRAVRGGVDALDERSLVVGLERFEIRAELAG